jgi:hypothetical protein
MSFVDKNRALTIPKGCESESIGLDPQLFDGARDSKNLDDEDSVLSRLKLVHGENNKD